MSISIDHFKVFGLEEAFYGMRLPMKSTKGYTIQPEDIKLAQNLNKAGHESHSKFMRQIGCSMVINAPLYWWRQMDTYKVGTTTNSESTMHTFMKDKITLKSFSWSGNDEGESTKVLNVVVKCLNQLQTAYILAKNVETKKKLEMECIQLLPSSFMQKRYWTANYAVLKNIYITRANHKLPEWEAFNKFIFNAAPLFKELINV